MSTRTKTKPVVVDVDLDVVDQVLERARAALPPEDHECLKGLVGTLHELLKLVRQRGTTIAALRRLFGLSSSEKMNDVLAGDAAADTGQSHSGAATSAEHSINNDAADDHPADREANTDPKGHGRIPAAQYPDASRTEVEHQSLKTGDVCPSCARGTLYRLREPARILRIVGRAPLAAAVWECMRLRCSACGEVFTASAPDHAQGPKYDASAVAMMALLRYGAGMPLNRLDRLQKNLDTPLPASTQWEVVSDRVAALKLVFDELCRQAANGRVVHNDDTSIRILSLMGKRRAKLCAQGELPDPDRTGLFTTAVVSETDAGTIALFLTGRNHAGENLSAVLARRDLSLPPPIQMCDGLDRNRPGDHRVVQSNCLCHGRRHVVDEVENFPRECRYVLEALGEVFKHESFCKKHGLRGQARLEFHQQNSARVMADLEKWIRAELDEKRVEPNSGLGDAFNYLLRRWHKLTAFLRVPDAPIENNICERALKMAMRHRNNSLFYRSLLGAEVGDVYMTLIYTAELHHENPLAYLVALLEHEADVAADPAAWLPWTFRATLARSASRAA